MGCQRSEPAAPPDLAILRHAAQELAIALDARALDRFERYFQLLSEHGRRFNLTAVRDYAGVQRRHFVESLAAGAALVREGLMAQNDAIIDVGSGAGFPGMPLSIAWPELRVTLLEATRKKAEFIALIVRELALEHTEVVHARAEDAGHRSDLRERFDIALARAVAPLAGLVELTLPFVRAGGVMGAIKGSRLDAEIEDARGAIRICGGSTPSELQLRLESLGPSPRLLVVPKRRATPRSFPRASGTPARSPLS
jgi:16S rRNA (guanine527-N7)-methyltransferase